MVTDASSTQSAVPGQLYSLFNKILVCLCRHPVCVSTTYFSRRRTRGVSRGMLTQFLGLESFSSSIPRLCGPFLGRVTCTCTGAPRMHRPSRFDLVVVDDAPLPVSVSDVLDGCVN